MYLVGHVGAGLCEQQRFLGFAVHDRGRQHAEMVGAFQVAHEPRFGELDEQRHGEPWDTRSFGVVESDDGAAVAVVDAEVDGGNVGHDVGSDDDDLEQFDRRVVRHPDAAGESVDPSVLVERPHDRRDDVTAWAESITVRQS